jgi:hypothetical protein
VALPTVTDLKSYLRIESNAENTLLTALLARAQAQVELWIDCPVTAVSQTSIDRALTLADYPVMSLVFPRRPIAVTSITDGDGVVVPTDEYWVDGAAGMIYAEPGYSFANGRYTITANCGLSLSQHYALWEPVISQCIIDLAADLYQKRTPNAASETSAATTITWDVSRDTAARVLKVLRALKLPVAVG